MYANDFPVMQITANTMRMKPFACCFRATRSPPRGLPVTVPCLVAARCSEIVAATP